MQEQLGGLAGADGAAQPAVELGEVAAGGDERALLVGDREAACFEDGEDALGLSARLTARSAYRLRARSPAFAAAWDTADQLAVGRLSALAFDRAINGRTEQVWHEGQLVAEKRL